MARPPAAAASRKEVTRRSSLREPAGKDAREVIQFSLSSPHACDAGAGDELCAGAGAPRLALRTCQAARGRIPKLTTKSL